MDNVGTGFSLTIDRTMDGLVHLAPFVDQVTSALELDRRTEYALRLCLEEAVTNLVMHGQQAPGDLPDTVALRLRPTADRLDVIVEDRCIPFDPRDAPTPERPSTLDELKVGGLGIHLMRQYASAVDYGRYDEANRLHLVIGRGHL